MPETRECRKFYCDSHINFHLYHYAGNNPVRYMDPTGLYDEESGYSGQEIKDFKKMSVSEQLAYLKSQVSSVPEGTYSAGVKASHMREQLKDSMKLNGLFYSRDGDEKFMNEKLRDFLNTKEDGSDYTIKDIQLDLANWTQLTFPGDNEHQHNQNGGRNQKFINKDGREVVFDAKDNFIGNGMDKETYNYSVPSGLSKFTSWTPASNHGRYDMKPFFRQNHIQPIYWRLRVGTNYGWNSK